MKVRFKKDYKMPSGKKIKKGTEEAFTNEVARSLIKRRYAEPILEYTDTGILDTKGNKILKQK